MSELTNDELFLYMRVYSYYRDLIEKGVLTQGMRLPSVRKCSQELGISRTTAENAYLQLAADGYVAAKPQSGYYVTAKPVREQEGRGAAADTAAITASSSADKAGGADREAGADRQFDFTSGSVDPRSFDFSTWRRYIKSALREDGRLLSYGEPQGERLTREAICEYVRRSRNINCLPDDIVIGAGIQSLLHILCPLLPGKRISFPTPGFTQGIRIFLDHGYEVTYRDKDAQIIYVSPSHMNRWGEAMPVGRRLELIRRQAQRGGIIIEDDYESEFPYPNRHTPAVHSLSGGEGVVYLGTFSRLLLPSIRLSFMILPPALSQAFKERRDEYNQTASKTEQIALGQFIRDGHLESRIRKLRRLYEQKTRLLTGLMRRELKASGADGCEAADGGLCTVITLREEGKETGLRYPVEDGECRQLMRLAQADGWAADAVLRDGGGNLRVVLSVLGIPEERMEDGARRAAATIRSWKLCDRKA